VPAKHPVVVVTERGGERCMAAERWWFHETRRDIEVRQGTAWVLEFDSEALPVVDELVTLRDRRHGLLCNPRSQDARTALDRIPFPWLSPEATA
jgi:hypothetical protein